MDTEGTCANAGPGASSFMFPSLSHELGHQRAVWSSFGHTQGEGGTKNGKEPGFPSDRMHQKGPEK